jgi:hypothetical protein
MSVRIGKKIHSTYQADRSGESGLWVTGCGRIHSGPWISDAATCKLCIKAERTLIDPEKVQIPKLKFGAPETVILLKDAIALKKAAVKSGRRMDYRRRSLEATLADIQVRIKAGTLANRCPCGKFPWEHRGEKCGPRNAYRRARLLRLYMKRPERSLEGSNVLVGKAVNG